MPHLKKITRWQRHATPWERRLISDSVHMKITSTFKPIKTRIKWHVTLKLIYIMLYRVHLAINWIRTHNFITDCARGCKSNYHTIMTVTQSNKAPIVYSKNRLEKESESKIFYFLYRNIPLLLRYCVVLTS